MGQLWRWVLRQTTRIPPKTPHSNFRQRNWWIDLKCCHGISWIFKDGFYWFRLLTRPGLRIANIESSGFEWYWTLLCCGLEDKQRSRHVINQPPFPQDIQPYLFKACNLTKLTIQIYKARVKLFIGELDTHFNFFIFFFIYLFFKRNRFNKNTMKQLEMGENIY